MNKTTFIVVVLVIVIALGGWYFVSGKDDGICIQVITPAKNIFTGNVKEFPTPCDVPWWYTPVENVPIDMYEGTFMQGDEEWQWVRNDAFHIAFAYRINPNGYVLFKSEEKGENAPSKAYTLFLKEEYEDLQKRIAQGGDGEGPPAIGVGIYEVSKGTDILNWLRTHLGSNFAEESQYAEAQIEGRDAIRYGWEGLYGGESVVAVFGNYMYVFSGDYFNDGHEHQKDFEAFLGTIHFLGARGTVSSFEECIAVGNPVMESYPRQCRTPDGKSFTEFVGNEIEKQDLIRIAHPRPNEIITSPLTISGEARGYWFFEASFPVTLVDWDGKIIAQHYAQAEGEWMTENFVPYTSELTFENPSFPNSEKGHFSKRGFLILHKDNPSGLPEHDDALEIPVWFE